MAMKGGGGIGGQGAGGQGGYGYGQGQGQRGLSPNSFRGNMNPNVSVHSEHLWNMMEDV